MTARPISDGERDKFTQFSTDPAENARLRSDMDSALSRGQTSLDWCLVAEDGDRFVGRIFLWAPSGNPVFVHLLDLDWSRPDWRDIGLELIEGAVKAVSSQAENVMLYALDEPHPWHSEPARRAELFEGSGFQLIRRGKRWAREAASGGTAPLRLRFRTLGEVGDAAFREAIARVSDGTLDGRLQEMRNRLGRENDAAEHFRLLMGFRHEPDWWQLAFDADGRLVGLVVSGGDEREPVIAYVGVVPEQRGHRYVDDLLAAALATLSKTARVIRADTDIANVPMGKAFTRAGFAQFMSRTEYMLTASSGA